MYESAEIIARKQYDLSEKMLRNVTTVLKGPVEYRHSFLNMENQQVVLDDGTIGKTCPAAVGYSFAAGTTDGFGE